MGRQRAHSVRRQQLRQWRRHSLVSLSSSSSMPSTWLWSRMGWLSSACPYWTRRLTLRSVPVEQSVDRSAMHAHSVDRSAMHAHFIFP